MDQEQKENKPYGRFKRHLGHSTLWKWIGGIVAVLVAIAVAAALYFNAKWKPMLSDKIRETVHDASQGLYRIDFKNIRVNLITGSVTLDSIHLMPDTARFNQLRSERLAPTHLFNIKLAKLRLRHVGLLTVYFKKRIDMTDIILDRPSINMIYNKVQKRPDTTTVEKTLYEQISKSLKSIHVKAIKVDDADFDYINGANGKLIHSVKRLNILIKDLLIDSLADKDTTRFYYTKDVAFYLAGYESLSGDKMYTTKADSIVGSASDRMLRIKGLKMIPMYPDLAFSRKYPTQKDRYDLNFQTIRLQGVDFVRLNRDGSLHAHSATIGPAKVGVFMNRERPPVAFDKGRNYPHMALKRVPMELLIDTVRISNVDVAYTEYNPITKKRGTVYLDNLTGRILNVTTDSAALAQNNHARATLSTTVMKTVKLTVNLDLNLTAKDGSFTYSGSIGSMNMKDLNPLSEALGLVKIERGRVQKADFNFRANLYGSQGTMRFHYTDLKIAMLKEDEDGGKPKKQGLLSFLANTVLVKDANPSKGEAPRTANVAFERTPAASFFNLLWKGVFIGIRETVGVGIVPAKSPEQSYQKIEDKLSDRKEKSKERKVEERKEKREERQEQREKRREEKEKN